MGSARCYRFTGKDAPEEMKRRVREAHPRLIVQSEDPAAVSGEGLAQMIGAQTLEACRAGHPLARKPEVDLLLRLGGTTQIAEAIRAVGAKPGGDFVLLVVGEESDLAELESGEASTWERLPRSGLGREDLLRTERAALLDAERA